MKKAVIMFCLVILLLPVTSSAKTKKFTLSAAGDCTLASDITQPSSVNFPTMYRKKGASYFLKKVRSVFNNDDLTLVNFEGTISNRGKRVDKKWAFRGKPAYVDVLKKGSVEAVSLANNHINDYGPQAKEDTKKLLEKSEISYSSESKGTIRIVQGVRVGLVSISTIEVGYSPEKMLRQSIANLKKRKPDVLIVSMHSGTEYTQVLQPIQKHLSHLAIDLGADVVIGHHPHIMQGIEKYKGSYILYSLGNFCFGGNTNPCDKDAYIFQQTFEVSKGKHVVKKDTRVIPVRISGNSGINNYQPVICSGKQKKRIIQRLNRYSEKYKVKISSSGKVKS